MQTCSAAALMASLPTASHGISLEAPSNHFLDGSGKSFMKYIILTSWCEGDWKEMFWFGEIS